MQKINNYNKIVKIINYFFLLLFIFWLPLKDDYLPLILALWIFTWLLEGNFKNRFSLNPYWYLFGSLTIYFLLTVINLFKANNIDYGLFHIQEKLSLVFFPIILLGSNKKVENNQTIILKIFILGNLVASLYCLAFTFFDSLKLVDGKYIINYYVMPGNYKESFWELINLRYNKFSYNYLSIFKHPSYFSMFITFSIIIIINFFRTGQLKKNGIKVLSVLIILFFIFMLYLLQSRAAFITFASIILLIPLIEILKKFKKRFLFLFLSLFVILIVFFTFDSKIKENAFETYKVLQSKNIDKLKNADERLQLWYASLQVIKDNFWIGTSPANLTYELVKKYEELGFQNAANKELNTHSQYLESWAGLGILGFLSLIFIIGYTFVISIKQKHYLLFFLMVILSINFFFEAMLNRMAAILFMMFFISLFVFTFSENKKLSTAENQNFNSK